MLISFVRPLFINKRAKNVMKKRHPETNTRQNNDALIPLTLFVP